MIQKITDWLRIHEGVVVGLLTLVFLLIRIPGLSQPLHQDEYKWPLIVNPAHVSDTEIPHPPLSQFIYREAGQLVGFNVHFRLVPLFFGTLNLLLLYYFLRKRFGFDVAFIGATLFTLSYFSVLASLMVDTDGQIMPFFFLLALIGYYNARATSSVPADRKKRVGWLSLLVGACLCGFFIKVSFILAICAIGADFLWEKKGLMSKKEMLKYASYVFGAGVGLVLLLVLAPYVFPFFHLGTAVTYWEHFLGTNRNWFQTGIQMIKALLYSSPFLIFVPFFLPKTRRTEVKLFLFYLFFGFIFYIILFDFSIGALDRYLQFIIIPLCVLCAVTIHDVWKQQKETRTKEFLFLGVCIAALVSLTLTISYTVPSLHPKAAWLSRVASLHWDFLYPFSGGSGPLGFYVPFLFMALVWILSIILVGIGYFKPTFRKYILILLLPLSLVYTGVFTEEYLYGKLYGSAPTLLSHVVTFIKNDPTIEHVTVYNDNGGNEIQALGKYRKRLYTDPAFDLNQKIASLNQYKEHYLELNIPRIDPESVYRRYLDSCTSVYSETDHYISAVVYDCREVADITQ